MANNVATGSTCTIVGGATSCTTLPADLAVAAGDLVNVRVSSTGTPAGSGDDSKIKSTFSYGDPPISP